MVSHLVLKSLAIVGLVGGLAASPCAAADLGPEQGTVQAAEPTTLKTLSSMLGRLHHLSGYVRSIAQDANTVSKQEIAVSKQYRCLAQAVYFEARGESNAGQRAVAHVVLNRLKDNRYPNTVCGVVFQNQHLRNRCQFSFACDGLSDTPREASAWHHALQVALEALAGVSEDVTNASTHYHATYVEPFWASHLKPTVKVGAHLFYQEPGPEERYMVSTSAE